MVCCLKSVEKYVKELLQLIQLDLKHGIKNVNITSSITYNIQCNKCHSDITISYRIKKVIK